MELKYKKTIEREIDNTMSEIWRLSELQITVGK
jgi:hypothetical protein